MSMNCHENLLQLKYVQSEGLVQLGRGGVRLLDRRGLERLARDSLREK